MDVLFVSTSKADSGPLQPVLDYAASDHSLRCGVARLQDSRIAPPGGIVDVPLDLQLTAGSPHEAVQSGHALAERFDQLIAERRPRMITVLGDRWELLYLLPVAVLWGTPVMHLHGGELSFGAIDERVRHAVTKMSDFHCVATTGAARRVRQLGEPAKRIWITGAPGVDRLIGAEPLSADDWKGLLGKSATRPLGLVTYHPATAGEEDPIMTTNRILDACTRRLGTVIATHPGEEHRSGQIVKLLQSCSRRTDNLVVIRHLGNDYPRVMASSDVLVGNSSSGIIEAAAFGIPVVDVGIRQQGRETGRNVIHCSTTVEQIRSSLDQALSPEFRAESNAVVNPYGDGHASMRVVAAIREALEIDASLKTFADLQGGSNAPK